MKAFLNVMALVFSLMIKPFKSDTNVITKDKNMYNQESETTMKDLVILETLFELGSLQVWCANTTEQVEKGLRPTHYFWRDTTHPQGFGPFARIYDAMVHYTNVSSALKAAKVPRNGMGQVIQVDFVTKRRL